MSTAIDERVVRRLEALPERLAVVAESSHASVEQMQRAVTELVKNIDNIGVELRTVAVGARSFFEQAADVAKALQRLSGESEQLLARLSKPDERIASTTGATIEKMQAVLETYQARLVQEVSRSAPDLVKSALSSATADFTHEFELKERQSVRSTRSREHGFSESGATIRRRHPHDVDRRIVTQQRVEQVDTVLSKLGGLLEVAGTTWSPHVETTRTSLDQLTQSLARWVPPAAVLRPTDRVCEEMERATRKLSSSIQTVVSQSAALGEINGILQSELG